MNQEEINKRNEAIANFMGFKAITTQEEWQKAGMRGKFLPGWVINKHYTRQIKDFTYQNNWESLIYVVEKIEQNEDFCTEIISARTIGGDLLHRFIIRIINEYNSIQALSVEGKSKIEAVFIGVSNFCLTLKKD